MTSKRQTRSKANEETVVLLEKTVETETVDPSAAAATAAPLSAIAARRAAINAGLYNPEPVEHSEEELDEEDEDEDEHLQHAAEGVDIQSVTDEENDALRDELDEDRVMSPISGAATPNGASTPLRPLTPMTMEPSKPKNKM